MEDIIKSFHIDWKLMVAQLINFSIVAWVLWRWALKPLTAVMSKRAQEISDGLANAKKASEGLEELKHTKQEMIKDAKREAAEIQKQAEAASEKYRQETITKVKSEAEKAVAEVKQKFMTEKDQMLKEVQRQAASLVVQATTKVLGKITTPKFDQTVIQQAIKEVTNKSKAKTS